MSRPPPLWPKRGRGRERRVPMPDGMHCSRHTRHTQGTSCARRHRPSMSYRRHLLRPRTTRGPGEECIFCISSLNHSQNLTHSQKQYKTQSKYHEPIESQSNRKKNKKNIFSHIYLDSNTSILACNVCTIASNSLIAANAYAIVSA